MRLALSNGALIQTENPTAPGAVDLTLSLTKSQLPGLLAGDSLDGIEHTGVSRLRKLIDLLNQRVPDSRRAGRPALAGG